MIDREFKISAAFLYNFIQFVIWTDVSIIAADYFVFCVVENNEFANILKKIVRGHTVSYKRIRGINVSETDSLSDCHLLYIHQEKPSLNSLYTIENADMQVLTVGSSVTFKKLGGKIRFYMKNNKLKFETDFSRLNLAVIPHTRLIKQI